MAHVVMMASGAGQAARAAVLADLHERFPGVPCWWGVHTRRWWAMVAWDDRPRLVEAGSPEELIPIIIAARLRPGQ
ncbi:hypothetical protein [Actinomadura sp. HBU206391]|uniref:hypothetical protein n=1 Tax=Actinomadura sp. HBU206391 TaxID=2731692 RepID=UPI00164F74A8|nr:hypothetical protein [Actinomadura sp. HBU206391]MBC6463746.1 hypothetical protein [Actinomadura sp. HBU206391]